MKKGPQPGWRYATTESPVSIGSAPESDMVVSDPQVSDRHAMIWREREYYYIQEVSTEYGTFVSGERLTKARLLRDGDEIGLGPVVVLVFQSTS
jgi:pSer/pThr/pTyr-binding forkhead associated (FHA) protein